MMHDEIAAGIDLNRFYPELDHHLLVAVTETVSYEDCDRFIARLVNLNSGQQAAKAAITE